MAGAVFLMAMTVAAPVSTALNFTEPLDLVPPLPDPVPDRDEVVPSVFVRSQNDAGSGADAPNDMEDAYGLAAGAYAGVLLHTPTAEVAPVNVLDAEDWYKIPVTAGERLEVAFSIRPDPVMDTVAWTVGAGPQVIVLELYTPSGHMANFTQGSRGNGSPFDPAPKVYRTGVVAEETGTYYVRFSTWLVGAGYDFTLRVGTVAGVHRAYAGNGYAVWAFDVPAGGRVDGVLQVINREADDEPVQIQFVRLEGPNLDNAWAADYPILPTFIGLPSATVGDEHLEIEHPADTPTDFAFGPRRFSFTTPGRYWVGAISKALDSYIVLNGTVQGGAAIVAASTGGEDKVVALKTSDFSDGVTASTILARVAVNASASHAVGHRLIGQYDCGSKYWGATVLFVPISLNPLTRPNHCRAVAPNGAVYNIGSNQPVQWLALNHAVPGTWTFHRELEVQNSGEKYVLFGADVDLSIP